jgi:BioD-like phosphotransacetylase family protein
MSYIFICSTGDHAGQSLITSSIALRLLEKKITPGIFKPFGTGLLRMEGIWTDPDAHLLKELLGIQEPLDMICPYPMSEKAEIPDGQIEMLDKIKSIANGLAEGKDIVLVVGSRHIFFDDAPCSLPDVSLISELNADLVLVHRYRQTSTTLYSILSVHSLLRDRVKGIIINRVQPGQLEAVKEQVMSVLNKEGIGNVAVLPEDPLLSLRSIEEIRQMLEGRIICCEEYRERLVGGMTVGTAGLDKGLMIFRRVYNKIFLLEPSTTSRKIAGVLLTGNRKPPEKVLEAAKKAQIPLILVKDDSFVAEERLEKSAVYLSPADEKKIRHFMSMMDRDDYLNRLIESMSK